jgi:hypothetical protein
VDEPVVVGAAVGAAGAVGNGGRAKPASVARTDLDPFADPFA